MIAVHDRDGSIRPRDESICERHPGRTSAADQVVDFQIIHVVLVIDECFQRLASFRALPNLLRQGLHRARGYRPTQAASTLAHDPLALNLIV